MMKNGYRILGEETIIVLKRRDGQTMETRISTIDLPSVQIYRGMWSFRQVNEDKVYASGSNNMTLHRWISNPTEGLEVDHIDGDTMNNTRSNLRVATRSQNQHNSRKKPLSGCLGVSYSKARKKWRVRFKVNGNSKEFGQYKDCKEAVFQAITVKNMLRGLPPQRRPILIEAKL